MRMIIELIIALYTLMINMFRKIESFQMPCHNRYKKFNMFIIDYETEDYVI